MTGVPDIIWPPGVEAVLAWAKARREERRPIYGPDEVRDFTFGDAPKVEHYLAAADVAGAHPGWLKAICHLETLELALTNGKPPVRIVPAFWKALSAHEQRKLIRSRELKPLNPPQPWRRWRNFEALAAIDQARAIRSCRFGVAQLDGLSHMLCGFERPELFLAAMRSGPGPQVMALGRFIAHERNQVLKYAMQAGDVAEIARHWRGQDRPRAYARQLGAVFERVRHG